MKDGARTPEELETLFEDAFLLRDGRALTQLFEPGAVLLIDDGIHEARGGAEISRLAAEMWRRDSTYIADAGRVLQVHDTALVLAPGGINVLRRAEDGSWRYAISLLRGRPMSAGPGRAR